MSKDLRLTMEVVVCDWCSGLVPIGTAAKWYKCHLCEVYLCSSHLEDHIVTYHPGRFSEFAAACEEGILP